ncbi:hypothetical protein ACIBSS_32010 [Micromonospora aurantiaca]|uniref:hypothetical protein n=1 Tax=Micromonospora aurantiaca (nom. illeg.) TaxID=47850 RepID=UPI0008284A5A|nr:hypothetical protein [Micromonospora aurantiaca]SCL43698.1 hypothetical protein GA0070615_6739 [Micromonospora aurantiaca]SCL43725.1 hypothetical protein GA0070615_6766 [Micromonospora aurantiaca]
MSVDQDVSYRPAGPGWRSLDMGEFERRGELLVPAGAQAAVIEPEPATPAPAQEVREPERGAEDQRVDTARRRRSRREGAGSADELREQLEEARAVVEVRREDERERRERDAEHRIALARIQERERAEARERREDDRDAAEDVALAELYRRAKRSGERARIRAEIGGSAEMRALRVAKVRTVALLAGIPVLAAFAAWSTTGVQAGVVKLLNLDADTASWWAAWAVEPALIAIVALIIIGRAVLRASGGNVDWKAGVAEWSALGLSLALNIVGGWHGGWDGLLTALPHSIGPVGCAGTAFLIGLFDSYVTAARPWEGAPRLAELNITPPVRTAIKRGKYGPAGVESAGLPDDVRTLLADVQTAIQDGALSTDPSGYAIYKHVMGGKGDRARASKAAALVAGWRPGLRAA